MCVPSGVLVRVEDSSVGFKLSLYIGFDIGAVWSTAVTIDRGTIVIKIHAVKWNKIPKIVEAKCPDVVRLGVEPVEEDGASLIHWCLEDLGFIHNQRVLGEDPVLVGWALVR